MTKKISLWENWMKKDKEKDRDLNEVYSKIKDAYDGIKLGSWRSYTKKKLTLDELASLAFSCNLVGENEKSKDKVIESVNYVLNRKGYYLSYSGKNKYSITDGSL